MFTSYKVQHQKVKKTYHAVRVVQCQCIVIVDLSNIKLSSFLYRWVNSAVSFRRKYLIEVNIDAIISIGIYNW